jgi:hypothetical protein
VVKTKRSLVEKFSEMLENAQDFSIEFDDLGASEQLMRIVAEQGDVSDDGLLGSTENPTTLHADVVYDEVECEKCKHKNKIRSKNVPKNLRVYENFANGHGASLRPLIEKHGLKSSKAEIGDGLIWSGSQEIDLKETYSSIPSNVRKHFDVLVSVGDLKCAECPTVLHGKDWSGPRNWQIDHANFIDSYECYNTSQAYKHDTKTTRRYVNHAMRRKERRTKRNRQALDKWHADGHNKA